MTAPPAEGVRVDWDSLPGQVRAGIERMCGSPVIRARSQPGGFSPGLAARLECADGSRWFVKAVSSAANPDSCAMHRREAQILRSLDPMIVSGTLPAPRMRGTLEADPWTVVILDDIDGRHPRLPWEPSELAAVAAAVEQLADALTPSPIETRSVSEYFAADFTGWRTLAAAADPGAIDAWSKAHLDELAELEHQWPQHLAGQTLLHADIRADNLLLTGDRRDEGGGDGGGGGGGVDAGDLGNRAGRGDVGSRGGQRDRGDCANGGQRVVFVDWPHACIGAAFADMIFMAPSVTMQADHHRA